MWVRLGAACFGAALGVCLVLDMRADKQVMGWSACDNDELPDKFECGVPRLRLVGTEKKKSEMALAAQYPN